MSNINVAAFREAARLGEASLGKDHDDKATIVTAQKKLGGRFLDWMAGNVLKNTNWGSGRLSQMRTERKLAFNLFLKALQNEYGVKDAHKANIGKAIHEVFGNKVPALNSKNVTRMESIAKNFKGTGEAKSLKRNLVVRWWESKGLDHPGHAAAGIRNRVDDNKAPDKYVSFWPGKSAGGKGEIFGKAQEGLLESDHRSDYGDELASRTKKRLESSRVARSELKEISGKADTFFRRLREIPENISIEEGIERLESAIKGVAGHIEIELDNEGNRLTNQSLKAEMKAQLEDSLAAFREGETGLKQCIESLKNACNEYTSTLANDAKFEPMSRQVGYYLKKEENSEGLDEVKKVKWEPGVDTKKVSWGVKAEKFFLPLAGANEDKTGDKKFTYFGLNEGKMVEHHDDLVSKRDKLQSSEILRELTPQSIDQAWEKYGKETPTLVLNIAKTLRDSFGVNSEEYRKLDECIANKMPKNKHSLKDLVVDLQKVIPPKSEEYVMPYKMVSKKENCAGYITTLMDLGGAGVFAPKPHVAVATSPNDTAAWAKSVLKEVDRLNQLVDDIITHENPNLTHTEKELQNLCPGKVWTAYQSLTEMRKGGEVSHGELMSKVKSLVEAITNDITLNRAVGAMLLKNIQDVYSKGGNPVG